MDAFNFEGTTGEAQDIQYTDPGTIDVFSIEDVKFDTYSTGTPYMQMDFKSDEAGQFNHRFVLRGKDAETTVKVLERIQHVHKTLFGEIISGDASTDKLKNAFKGKKIALKVVGRIADDGKVYADLPYLSFAAKPADIGELSFTNKQNELIADCRAAIAARSSQPASNGQQSAPAESDNDAF